MSPTATNPPGTTRCRCICPNGCDCGCTCPAVIELRAEQAARRAANGGPIRIQRKRIPGWRKPEGALYVGRGSRWGNPYRLGETQVRMPGIDGSAWQHEGRIGKTSGQRHGFWHPDGTVTSHLVQDATAEQVIELYRRWLTGRPELLAAARQQLAGRDLMCWCPLPEPGQPDHCHAAHLITLANAPKENPAA